MQAGSYYIGDPYEIFRSKWDMLSPLFAREGEDSHFLRHTYATYHAQRGTGTYFDQNGMEYSTEMGALSCIHIDDIPISCLPEVRSQIFLFPEDFTTLYSEETGIIQFGDIAISTGLSYEDLVEDGLEDFLDYEDE